jgi:hypothetical protein
VYRRADLLRTTMLVAALLLTAISTGASACGFAAADPRNILMKTVVLRPAALAEGRSDAIRVFHCRRFRAEMEPAWSGSAVRGRTSPGSMAGGPCEVEHS